MFVLFHPAALSSHSSINRISQWKEEGYGDFMHGALWIFATHHRINLGDPMVLSFMLCKRDACAMAKRYAICAAMNEGEVALRMETLKLNIWFRQ